MGDTIHIYHLAAAPLILDILKSDRIQFVENHGLVKPSKEENHCQESFEKLSLSWKKKKCTCLYELYK